MKRFLRLILTALLLLSSAAALAEDWTCPVCGCACTSNFCPDCGTPRPVEGETDIPEFVAIAANTKAGIDYEVLREVSWDDSMGHHYGLALKNMTDKTVNFKVAFTFMEADDHVIDLLREDSNACDPGCEVFVTVSRSFSFDHVSYSIACVEDEYYNDVHSFVTVTAEWNGNKAFFTGQNHGNVDAEFVRYDALFLDKDGQMVGYDFGYLIDNAEVLRPGQTIVEKTYADYDFESIELYYCGKTDKSVTSTEEVDPAAFMNGSGTGYEVEHVCNFDYSSGIIVKNTSEAACSFFCSVIFRDLDGRIVDTEETETAVVDPGYEAVAYMSSPREYDHMDYCIFATPIQEYMETIQNRVEVTGERAADGRSLKVTVLNTSDGVIHMRGCYFVLFDGDNKPVDVGFVFLHGENYDYDLRPGMSFTGEDTTYTPYESYALYVDGYCMTEEDPWRFDVPEVTPTEAPATEEPVTETL